MIRQKQNILGAISLAPADSIPNVFFKSSVVPLFLVGKVENKSFPCTHKLGERTGQVWRDNSCRVRTHEKNSGETVRRLGTIIQSIFCAQSGAGIRLNFWKWSVESRYPGALSPKLENFRPAFSPEPTDSPWVSEDGIFGNGPEGVGTQGIFHPYLKIFVPPFLPNRLTAPGSPRMVGSGTRISWKFSGQSYMGFCLFLSCP